MTALLVFTHEENIRLIHKAWEIELTDWHLYKWSNEIYIGGQYII